MSHAQLETANSLGDLQSAVGSSRSRAPSNLDRDIIAKFDEKRKAKYQLLKDLQMHDQGRKIPNCNSLCVDEIGKYKTGKCTIEYFLAAAAKHGIELSDASVSTLREKVLPGSHDVVNYVPVVKELWLRILPHMPDEPASQKGRL